MKKIKCLALGLLVGTLTSLSLAAEVDPFSFEGIAPDSQQIYWDQLMKYKTFGANRLFFKNNSIRITDKSGWIGTSKGNFTLSENGGDTLGGPIVVGNNLIFRSKGELFTTGPVHVYNEITYGGSDLAGFSQTGYDQAYGGPRNVFHGPQCAQNGAISGYAAFVPSDSQFFAGGLGYDACPIKEEYVNNPKLEVPGLVVPSGVSYNGRITLDNTTYTITVPEGNFKESYDIYLQSISMSNASKIVVQQQAGGRLTRIFVEEGFNFNSSARNKIVVAYKNEDGSYSELDNKDYAGTLLFYTTRDIVFPSMNAGESFFQGTFVSKGQIEVLHHLVLAGQLLANDLQIDTDFDGTTFRYVPFDPPVLKIDPELLSAGKYPESNSDSLVPVQLDIEPKTDVTFKYCFEVKSQSNTNPGYASIEDFNKKGDQDYENSAAVFPICGSSNPYKEVLIKANSQEPTDNTKIYINVKKDTDPDEGDEKLVLSIFEVEGAVMPGNKHEGTFVLTITDETTPKFKHEDTDPYQQDENTPKTPVVNGAPVGTILFENMSWEKRDSIIIEMRNLSPTSGSVLADALFDFVLDANASTQTVRAKIVVGDASKLDYEKIPHNYEVGLTLKYIRTNSADETQLDTVVVDTLIRKIDIIDINEAPTINYVEDLIDPVIPATFVLHPNENMKDGDSVGVVRATDPDTSVKYSHLEYSIITENIPFTMRNDTIVVSDYTKLDYETNKTFTFDVVVSSCEWDAVSNSIIPPVPGGQCPSDTQTVNVILQNVNEPPVIVDDGKDHYDVDENKYATGTPIAEFEIQDVDAGDLDNNIVVSMSDDNNTGVDTLFRVVYDNTAHKIYVQVIDSAKIDFEKVKPVHKVTITVSDGGLQDTVIRTINIIDVNETPTITGVAELNKDYTGTKEDFTLYPKENLKDGDSVGVVLATDPDSLSNGRFDHLEFKIVPTNPVPFKMKGDTIVVDGNDQLDYEGTNVFTFDVKVTNCEWDVASNAAVQGGSCLEDVKTVTVKLQDVNEPPIIIKDDVDHYDVDENKYATGTPIAEFEIQDVDAGNLDSKIQVSVSDDNATGVESLFEFGYDKTTHKVYVSVIDSASINYEEIEVVHKVTITITDGEFQDTVVRAINIIDVNEAPNIDKIVDANGNADVLSTDSILKPFENMRENEIIGTIVASDPDTKHVTEFGHLEYILVDDPTDPVPFKMIGPSIAVADTSAMNAELDKEYTFKVVVKNCEWDASLNAYSTSRCLEDEETIRVQIQNEPERPVISCKADDANCNGPFVAIENSKGDSVIHEFILRDEDKDQLLTMQADIIDVNDRGADTLFKAVVEYDATLNDYVVKIEVMKDGVLDYEKLDSTYSIKLKVTDKDNLADSIFRVINIRDVNETPTVDPFNKEITENLPDSAEVGALVAADPDIRHSEFSQLTYTILGADSVPFFLDSNVIYVGDSSKLDFETHPTFKFQVEVSDGEFKDTALVTITLSDVDERPKIITDDNDDGEDDDKPFCVANCQDTTNRGSGPDSVFTVIVDENKPTGTVVLKYVVSDEDRDEVRRLEPSLKDNNNTGVDSLFKVYMDTSVANKTWLVVAVKDGNKLNFENIEELHEVTIIVTDSTGLQDSIVRRIQVRDLNEAPTVEPFEKTVAENLHENDEVGELEAADPDSKNPDFRKLTYTIIEQNVPFKLDSNIIKVKDPSRLNYETDTLFSFHVVVSDGEFKDTATVKIHLEDVDESPKIITDDDDDGDDDAVEDSLCVAHCEQDTTDNRNSGDEHGKNALTVGVDENVPTGTVVLQYYVYDEDAGDLKELEPALVQISSSVEGYPADSLFKIDMVPDGERVKIVVTVKDSAKLDYEALRKAENRTDPEPEYTVRIIVSEPDGYKDALKDTIIRVIRVKDVNEAPIFEVWPSEIAENNMVGDSLGRIEHPTDPDSLSKTPAFYNNVMELVDGDTALFALDTTRGPLNYILVAKAEFDCEARDPVVDTLLYKCGIDGAYHVTVDYYDPVNPTIKLRQVVPITLVDVNEKPKIATDSVEVKENVKKGTVVDTIKATDPDVYDSVLTYTLVEDKSGCFEVSKRGVITVKKDNCPALDYETNKELPITVKVTDNGTNGKGEDGTLSDTKTVIVKITDVNEAPKIDDKTIHVAEDTKVNTDVDTVTASDPDKDPKYNELVYRIVEGDTSVFKIDSITGVITLKDSLDYETKPEYKLVVEVDDGEFTDKATVTVKVDNVFEQPEVQITRAETTDMSWTDPDTIYINKKSICIEWTASERKSGKTLKDSSECGIELDEGENTIVREFKDPTMDKPGYDTLVVYVSTETPVVTVRKVTDELDDPNIFTVVEESSKGDTAFYVNDPANDLIVTVKDPVAGTKESFTVKVDLDTVSVPSKTYKKLSEITDFGIALNDDPASGVTYTPVNGEKIAVSYTEKVNGKDVTITYYTDNDGELIEDADGVVEMTVTYVENINGIDVKFSYQADAATGAVIKTSGGYVKSEEEEVSSSSSSKGGKSSSSKGGKSSSSSKEDKSKKVENEVVFTVSYEVADENGNVMTVSYGVDAEGNIVKNENGCVGYEVGYTYTNKYGNSSTQSIFVVLDQAPPEVKILYPTEGEIIYSNYIDVKWTVDIGDGKGPIVQDTLVTQSLKKGGNPIVRMYRDKAGNIASDTVRVIMKNAKDLDIAVEQPVTEVTQDKVEEYYAANEPEKGETFAVTIYNRKTGKEVETLIGGEFDNKKGSGDEPYPGLEGHLGPTLGIETKVPTINAVGGLATLDDLVNRDGLVSLDGVDAANSEKIPVEEYIDKYCSDAFAEKVGSDISRANLYKTKMRVKIWIYTTLGSFVDYYTFTQDLDNPDYANNAGLLTLYFEMKPDKEGNVRTAEGRLMATGAYIYKTEVEMKSELQCTLPPVKDATAKTSKKGSVRTVTEDMLKSFGYKRPEKK